MRAILTLVIVAVVIVIVLIMTNVIDINQTQEGSMPEVNVEGGALPELDVDTADVDVGTETREVEVPTIDVEGADGGEADAER